MKEFVTAFEEVAREDAGEPIEEQYTEFKLDDRVMRAYPPNDGQLAFMLASLGRGQSSENRFGSIINIMLECLREEDRIYLEGRLLTRDKSRLLPVEKIEEIFEYLSEEWFGRPTQPPSGSAPSPQTDGQN